jgi:hypothetical protein
MVDVDTFLTALYVIADDFCQSRAPRRKPGPQASLSESEVVSAGEDVPLAEKLSTRVKYTSPGYVGAGAAERAGHERSL